MVKYTNGWARKTRTTIMFLFIIVAIIILFFLVYKNISQNSFCTKNYNIIYNQDSQKRDYTGARIYKKNIYMCKENWQNNYQNSSLLQKKIYIENSLSLVYIFLDSGDKLKAKEIAQDGWSKVNNLSPQQREENGLTPIAGSLYVVAHDKDIQ